MKVQSTLSDKKIVNAWQMKNRKLIGADAPTLTKCTRGGSELQPVPKGFEVFGGTCMALRTIGGKLEAPGDGDWVIDMPAGLQIINDGMFNALFTPVA